MKAIILKKILGEHVIGINKQLLLSHHDFLPSVIEAMQEACNKAIDECTEISPENSYEFHLLKNQIK